MQFCRTTLRDLYLNPKEFCIICSNLVHQLGPTSAVFRYYNRWFSAIRPSSMSKDSISCLILPLPPNSLVGFARTGTTRIYGSLKNDATTYQTHLRFAVPVMRNTPLRVEVSKNESFGLIQEQEINKPNVDKSEYGVDPFNGIKERFLKFKRQKYLKDLDHYQSLAKAQAPKFMIIACADSRVCPSNVLGFQPGEAFVIRNVANLVTPFENGPTETNAALEFSVNTLEVENILVVGHSCCGGIQALMSMEDDKPSSGFIRNWVINGKDAKLTTKSVAAHLNFDQQCQHCEKESIKRSLQNLLSYPWIEERISKGLLSIHGGYYDFVNCTFEKWTLEYNPNSFEEGYKYATKNREFWC